MSDNKEMIERLEKSRLELLETVEAIQGLAQGQYFKFEDGHYCKDNDSFTFSKPDKEMLQGFATALKIIAKESDKQMNVLWTATEALQDHYAQR